jgi:hypothetical protein
MKSNDPGAVAAAGAARLEMGAARAVPGSAAAVSAAKRFSESLCG